MYLANLHIEYIKVLTINIHCTIYSIMITIVGIIDINSSYCKWQMSYKSIIVLLSVVGLLTTCLKPLLDMNCNKAEFGFNINFIEVT